VNNHGNPNVHSNDSRLGKLLPVFLSAKSAWSDIDWARRLLSVRQALVQTKDGLRFKSPKTRTSTRTVSMSPTLIEILKKHRTRQTKNRWKFKDDYAPLDLVIAEEGGSPMIPQRFSDQFRALVASAGVTKVRLHDLRHSHASHALRAGVHPKVVSERLGHSGSAITLDLYSHVFEGMQEDAAIKVDDAIQAALAKLAYGTDRQNIGKSVSGGRRDRLAS